MKINLALYSISKIMSRCCIVILIVATIHMLAIFNANSNDQTDAKNIQNLYAFKSEVIGLYHDARYHPQKLSTQLEKIHTQSLMIVLSPSWLKTETLNHHSAQLLDDWQYIMAQISANKFQYVVPLLDNFLQSLDGIIARHQMLADKKSTMLNISELFALIIVISIIMFLLYYTNTYVSGPIKSLTKTVKALKNNNYDGDFPVCNNEIGSLSKNLQALAKSTQQQLSQNQQAMTQSAQQAVQVQHEINFLYTIFHQLNGVPLTSEVFTELLNKLAKLGGLKKLCIELNDGTFISSFLGCAHNQTSAIRVPIIIEGKPYGFIHYQANDKQLKLKPLIEIFSGFIGHALYQKHNGLQSLKIDLIEESSTNFEHQHDSLAKSISKLQLQSEQLQQQSKGLLEPQTEQALEIMQTTLADTNVLVDSLANDFTATNKSSDFREAVINLLSHLQQQSTARLTLQDFAGHFNVDFKQHIHLLQIIRGCVNDVIQIGIATKVDIYCTVTQGNVGKLQIIDNGPLLNDTLLAHKHDNLAVSKTHVTDINASFAINILDDGTEVEVTFPLNLE